MKSSSLRINELRQSFIIIENHHIHCEKHTKMTFQKSIEFYTWKKLEFLRASFMETSNGFFSDSTDVREIILVYLSSYVVLHISKLSLNRLKSLF